MSATRTYGHSATRCLSSRIPNLSVQSIIGATEKLDLGVERVIGRVSTIMPKICTVALACRMRLLHLQFRSCVTDLLGQIVAHRFPSLTFFSILL